MSEVYSEFFQIVAETLKKKRIMAGLTQKELGEITGRPQSAIGKIENTTGDIHLRVLYELCDAMNIDMVDFFTEVKASQIVSGSAEATEWDKVKAAVEVLGDGEKAWFAELVRHCLEK